jgi:protein ImuB
MWETKADRRYLAAWFPYLPADRILRNTSAGARDKADEPLPLVLVEKVKGASCIVAVSRAARRAGLAPGLTLADARARIPQLWVEEMDRQADADLLDAMAEDCDRVTPIITVDAPDGLVLDITGCGHLFGGEAGLRAGLSKRFRRAGLNVRTVIAGAPDTARALARHGRVAIVAPGEEAAAVRGLPIVALGLAHKDQLAISRAGLKTVGALAERPSALFTARFGDEMTGRLARLQGLAPSPLTPRRAVPMLWIEQRFAEPIGRMEDIETTLAGLVAEVCRMLLERREGARCVEASFHRADGAVRRIAVETGRGMRDAQALLRLFREKLDALADPLDPGFGFDLVRLCVLDAESLAMLQPGLDGHALEADEIANLADRLSARFGQDRVLRFVARDTHDPDRAARIVPVQQQVNDAAAWSGLAEGEPPLRPPRIFDPPQPVTIALAEVPDGPPRAFRWRRMEHRVVAHEGPERIAPEWWREASGEARDYYRVEDAEGRRFWLFRLGEYGVEGAPPRWFLHGAFG